jgi:hypothetical protein
MRDNMRRIQCLMVISLLLLDFGTGLPRAVAEGPLDNVPENSLDRHLRRLRFEKNGLDDVVDFLSDITDARIAVNWDALATAGVTKVTPITMRVRDMPLRAVMDQILLLANPKQPLGWILKDNVIEISVAANFTGSMVERPYDVRSLHDWRAHAASATQSSTRPSQPADPLLRMLYGSIAPASWKINGGHAELAEDRDVLMIKTTKENHALIANLIEKLKAHRTRTVQP